jgi:WD40 repeat protein
MGVVYRARQLRLNRPCVLKMILAGAYAGAEATGRFLAEAEAVARLQHPNIVQIHHIGEADGLPLFELEYVPGGSLDRRLDGTPWPARRAAELIEPLARGVAEAHRQGIVHRDLKPGNVLLGADGSPKLTDFGLAKSLAAESGLTRTDSILGSPSYMAPEQAEGKNKVVGPLADVYALGAILYELLTGSPPFRGTTALEILEQVKNADPVQPSRLVPGLPRDAETIALRCLQKEPQKRYDSADAVAEELVRFLHDEPILARQQSELERGLRWARRHRGIAIMAAAFSLLLVLATVVSLVVARRMAVLAETNERAAKSEREAKLSAQSALKTADAQRDRAEHNLYVARIGQAESALRLLDWFTAGTLLDQCVPEAGRNDLRGWEWSFLNQWCRPELRTVTLPIGGYGNVIVPNVLAVSPDGRLLVVGCATAFAFAAGKNLSVPTYVLDLGDGKLERELAGHREWVLAIAFRPDGKRLATAGQEGTIKVRETATWRELSDVSGDAAPVLCLDWTPDGRRLASADQAGSVRLWDPEAGRTTARIAHKAQRVAWSPDGKRIATGSRDQVQIWEHAAAQANRRVLTSSGDSGLAWAPDGRRLACVGGDGSLSVWDSHTGQVVYSLKHARPLSSVAFSPAGNSLVTAGSEGIIRVLDSGSFEERAAQFPGCENVTSLAFSADGRRIVATGWAMKGVKIFDAERDPRGRGVVPWLDQLAALSFIGESERVRGIEWEAGRLASVSSRAGSVRHEATFPVTASKAWPRGDFAFDVEGRRLASPLERDRAVVGIWDTALGRLMATVDGDSGAVSAVAFSPDGKRLATGASDELTQMSSVKIWDLDSCRAVWTVDVGTRIVWSVALASDGHSVAAAGRTREQTGWVSVWDTKTDARLKTPDGLGMVKCVMFHPREALLAIGDVANTTVHLWDLAAGTLITRPGPRPSCCVNFTPDGKRLASLGYDGSVHLGDPRTGEELLVLRSFGPPPGGGGWTPRLAFSADGSRIAAHTAHYLNFWDAGPPLASPSDPYPDDLAGWLRRSRFYAARCEEPAALAALERAVAIPTDRPEPWISHGLAPEILPRQAERAIARGLAVDCADPVAWLLCARELERSDRKREAEIARKKAQLAAEKRLSAGSTDEPAAWVLADVLARGLAALRDGNWTILEPLEMTSAGGAKLTQLPDGSILASGDNPDTDTLTVVARTECTGITGLRLEILPDQSLPALGPGRDVSGHLRLSGLRVAVASGDDRSRAKAVAFADAFATCDGPDDRLSSPRGPIDESDGTRWDIGRQRGLRNAIAFKTAAPVDAPAGSTWIIRLECRDGSDKQCTLGRFRLSVTSGPVTLFETALHKKLTEPEWNGWTRLGVVYFLHEDWQAAAAALTTAANAPGATATERLLLALALYHLNRRDEARRYFEGGVDWLRHTSADVTLRAIAVEAAALISGISRSQAEAMAFLDPVFPILPFAP